MSHGFGRAATLDGEADGRRPRKQPYLPGQVWGGRRRGQETRPRKPVLGRRTSQQPHRGLFFPVGGHSKACFPQEETSGSYSRARASPGRTHTHTHTLCRCTHILCTLTCSPHACSVYIHPLHTDTLARAHTYTPLAPILTVHTLRPPCDPSRSPQPAEVTAGTSPPLCLPRGGVRGGRWRRGTLPPLRKTLVWGGRGEEGQVSFNCHPLPSILSWTLASLSEPINPLPPTSSATGA